MELLSRYFNGMSKVIDEHDGILIEFIGDAILAMFGAPLRNESHPTSAVKATMAMLGELAKINKWCASKTPPLPELQIRCGIHTGSVLVGNMGFQARIKYGVIGENSNIPSRLEELNKSYGTNNLMSQDTYDRLEHEAFCIRPVDYVYLRRTKVSKSEKVYSVLGVGLKKRVKRHALWAVAQLHDKAMKRYIAREFEQAADMFAEVNSKMQELAGVESDTPSAIMCSRCQTYMNRKPRASWDGVWDPEKNPET